MIIVAGGDSFVYGSELANRANAFTALVSSGHDYQSVAWPGYANDSIARTVMAKCQQQDCAVIVSWTFPGRYEFRFNYNTRHIHSPWYTINSWTIQSNEDVIKQLNNPDNSTVNQFTKHKSFDEKLGIADFSRTYYQHVGSSEYWEIYNTLKEIVYLQNYLKVKKIPYLFTCADTGIFYNHTIEHADEFILGLYQQIDMSSWFLFPPGSGANQTEKPRGFYQWAMENKYPVGTTHPLDQAHADAAKLMQGKFNELVTKHIL
jgi:hypothetical protein